MKKLLIISLSLSIAFIGLIWLANQPFLNKNAVLGQEIQNDSSAWCDNSDEAIDFEYPIPIVWTAKMEGCLASCQGASFTRITEDDKYAQFAGYYPDSKGNYDIDDWNPIPDKYQKHDLFLKITGKWIGIQDDHSQTVFNGKCIPIVNIEKIEIIN